MTEFVALPVPGLRGPGVSEDEAALIAQGVAAADLVLDALAGSQAGQTAFPNIFADATMSGWAALWPGAADVPRVVRNGHKALKFVHEGGRPIFTPFPDTLAVGSPFFFGINLEEAGHTAGGDNGLVAVQVDSSGAYVGDQNFLYVSSATTSVPVGLACPGTRLAGAVALKLFVDTSGDPANFVTLSLADFHEGTSTAYRGQLTSTFVTPDGLELTREQVQGGKPGLITANVTTGHLLDMATGLPGDANPSFDVPEIVGTYPHEPMICDKPIYGAVWRGKNGVRRFGFGGGAQVVLPAGIAWETPEGCWSISIVLLAADRPTAMWVRGKELPEALLVNEPASTISGTIATAEARITKAVANLSRQLFNRHSPGLVIGKRVNVHTGEATVDGGQFITPDWMDYPGTQVSTSETCTDLVWADENLNVIAGTEFDFDNSHNPGMPSGLYDAATTIGSTTLHITDVLDGVPPYPNQPLAYPGSSPGLYATAAVYVSGGEYGAYDVTMSAPASTSATVQVKGGRNLVAPAGARKFRPSFPNSFLVCVPTTTDVTGYQNRSRLLQRVMFTASAYTRPARPFGLVGMPTARMAASVWSGFFDSFGARADSEFNGGNGCFKGDLKNALGFARWGSYQSFPGHRPGDDSGALSADALGGSQYLLYESNTNLFGTTSPVALGSYGDAPSATGTAAARFRWDIETILKANSDISILGVANGRRWRKNSQVYTKYPTLRDTSGWLDEPSSDEINAQGYTQFQLNDLMMDIFIRGYSQRCVNLLTAVSETKYSGGKMRADGVHAEVPWFDPAIQVIEAEARDLVG